MQTLKQIIVWPLLTVMLILVGIGEGLLGLWRGYK